MIVSPAYNQQLTPKQTNSLEVELVTATRFGFMPPGIVRPKGKFVLAFANRSRHDMHVYLDQVPGTHLMSWSLTGGHHEDHGDIDLDPGTYTLTNDHRSDWQCSMTIKP